MKHFDSRSLGIALLVKLCEVLLDTSDLLIEELDMVIRLANKFSYAFLSFLWKDGV